MKAMNYQMSALLRYDSKTVCNCHLLRLIVIKYRDGTVIAIISYVERVFVIVLAVVSKDRH